MSNHHIEKQLNLVINLLETLPKRMCDEMEKRHEIRKAFQIQAEIEFYAENHEEIDRFLQGFSCKKMDHNDEPIPTVEKPKKKASQTKS